MARAHTHTHVNRDVAKEMQSIQLNMKVFDIDRCWNDNWPYWNDTYNIDTRK